MTKRFKHSGTLGDIIYSLAIMRNFGGGEFYLHLNQIDWIGQHYYGSKPDPFHQGRMTQKDFDFMEPFFLAQDYITKFSVLDPKTTEITHNLDRFRPLFVSHPGNYVDVYSSAFGITDTGMQEIIRTTPWLTVPSTLTHEDRDIVINRSQRWRVNDQESLDVWNNLRDMGAESRAVFVGLDQEYREFREFTGWDIPYRPTDNLLQLAQLIAGAEQFIGNQSLALSLAIGLGVEFAAELRRDLPMERNECWFPNQPKSNYF